MSGGTSGGVCLTRSSAYKPPARTAMEPVRQAVDGLAVTLTVSVVFPDVPLLGETVNQGSFEVAVQDDWVVVSGTLIEAAAENGSQKV